MFFTTSPKNVVECFVLQNAYRENEKIKMRGVVFTQLPSEEELQNRVEQANDQISWLFNHAPVGIVFLSPDGTIIDGNQAAFQQFDLPANSILQTNIQSFLRNDEITLLNQSLKNIATFKQNTSSMDIHINHNNKDAVSTLYISAMKHVHAASSETIDGFVVYLIDSTRQKSLELQFAQAQKMQAEMMKTQEEIEAKEIEVTPKTIEPKKSSPAVEEISIKKEEPEATIVMIAINTLPYFIIAAILFTGAVVAGSLSGRLKRKMRNDAE